MPLFTPEELAELAAYDARIDQNFRLTAAERKQSNALDRFARQQILDPEKRAAIKKRANDKARAARYYQQHRAERLAYQRAYDAQKAARKHNAANPAE